MNAAVRPPRSPASLALLRAPCARASLTPPSPAPAGEDTLDTAFELGWDHARHGVTPPLETLCGHLRLQQGFKAGRAAFGRHTRPADRRVRTWLTLRVQALRQRLAFETVQLTPSFLAQIEVEHCPVTRERLGMRAGAPNEACIARLRPDAGFAAGHLAMLGARALAARGSRGLAGLLLKQRAGALAADTAGELDALQWGRWATLCSFVEPLPHAQAAALPLLVLPPNRLRLFNPVQALQALASRALQHRTPNRRLAALRHALPAHALRSFDAWLVAYRHELLLRTAMAVPGAGPAHWLLEDAWQEREVRRRWQRFAGRLEAPQCERIVLLCSEGRAVWMPEDLATAGWALETAGQTVPAGPRRACSGARTESQLRLFTPEA